MDSIRGWGSLVVLLLILVDSIRGWGTLVVLLLILVDISGTLTGNIRGQTTSTMYCMATGFT